MTFSDDVKSALWRAFALAWLLAAAATIALMADPALASPRHGARYSESRSGEDFHWSWKLPAGKTIEIKGVNGDIEAHAASGDEVEVVATKHAHRSDPDEVKIEVIEHEGGVTICSVYPTPWGEPANDCNPGRGGHSHTRNNDVVVDYEVRVPKGVAFRGSTVNGGVEAEGIEGPAEAYTVNGSVRVSTGGTARASTVNGSIVASVGSASWGDELAFDTVNGTVTVDFPSGLNADFRAETVNGDIVSDFPLTVTGRFSHRHISGTIGKGGGDLKLSTVNGDIRLRSSQ